MKKKILVTGAGGYIGRHVISELLKTSAEVIAVDISLSGVQPCVNGIEIDILKENSNIYKAVGEPDVCLHLAWMDGFVHNSIHHMSNLSAHYNFIREMIESGLKHLAVMGTVHEVGYFEGEVDETTPCNPISMYAIAKDALRRSIFGMAQKTNIILQWLRAFYIYGDDKISNSIFSKILQAEERGDETFPFTTGVNKYDFIHINEISKQIAACVIQSEVNGIINCCSGKPVSLAEQVEKFISNNSLKIKLDYGAFADRSYDSPAVWGNADKITKIMDSFEV